MSGSPQDALKSFLNILRDYRENTKTIKIEFEIQHNLYGKDYFKIVLYFEEELNGLPKAHIEEIREQIPPSHESTIYTVLQAEQYITRYEMFYEAIRGIFQLVKYHGQEKIIINDKTLSPNIESIEISTPDEMQEIIQKELPFMSFVDSKLYRLGRDQMKRGEIISPYSFSKWEYEREEKENKLIQKQKEEKFWKNREVIANSNDLIFYKYFHGDIRVLRVEELIKHTESESYSGMRLKNNLEPYSYGGEYANKKDVLIVLSQENLDEIFNTYEISRNKGSLYHFIKNSNKKFPHKYINELLMFNSKELKLR